MAQYGTMSMGGMNQEVMKAMAAQYGQQQQLAQYYQQQQAGFGQAMQGAPQFGQQMQGMPPGYPQAMMQQQQYQPAQMQQQAPPPKKPPTGDAGIVGLCACTIKALQPVAHMDPEWTLEEMAWKVCGYVGKAAAKYWQGEDERFTSRQTVAKGQAIIEEFVEACMYNLSAGCHEKPWWNEANFTDPLFHAVMGTFQNQQTRFMCRTLKPVIQKTVDDAVARFREEERVQKGIYEAVVISGLPEAYQKPCTKHLQGAYDRAHMQAPYGTTKGDTPELGLVQDFVKGWIEEFTGRAWSVLNEGVSHDREEQFAFLTTLFQHLVDPEQCCLPFELVSQPGAMPPENWAFVAETAMKALKEDETEHVPKKKRKKGAAAAMEGMEGGF